MVKYSRDELFVTPDYTVPLRSTGKPSGITEDGTRLVYTEKQLEKTHAKYLKLSNKLSQLPFGLYLSPISSGPHRVANIKVRALEAVHDRVNKISARTNVYTGGYKNLFANFHLQRAVISEVPYSAFSPLEVAFKGVYSHLSRRTEDVYSVEDFLKILDELKDLFSQELQELDLPVNDRNLEYLFALRLAASYGWLTPGYSRYYEDEKIETIIYKLSQEQNGHAKQDSYLPLTLVPWIRSEAEVEVALTALHPAITIAAKNPLNPTDIEGANELFSLPFDWWYQVLFS